MAAIIESDKENEDENVPKKIKVEKDVENNVEPSKLLDVSHLSKIVPKVERCLICKQYADEWFLYNGHPNNSVEEFVALTDERLLLFTGTEEHVDSQDERPSNKITYFNVYDKAGHLVAFDSGLIENDKLLYFSGYIKPIYDENDSPDEGIPAHDLGPINAWFISGFDGGNKAIISFATAYGEYYLMTPAPSYEPLMKSVNEKVTLSKLVIEFLLEESWQSPAYEDLLQKLNSSDSGIGEEALLRHAQFICDQVLSVDMDVEMDEDERPLITAPCIRTLIKMSGVTFKKRKGIPRLGTKSSGVKSIKKPQWSKATTTNLVHGVFESFFTGQIETKEGKGPKKKRCGVCEACQSGDCGACSFCRDMLKFGGTGRMKQACKQRRCPNMAIENADNSDNEDDIVHTIDDNDGNDLQFSKRIVNFAEFEGEPCAEVGNRIYYDTAKVGDNLIESGDYVMLNPREPNHPLLIAKVCYMWEDNTDLGANFHAHIFIRGSHTILGETADPREIFLTDFCENSPLGVIVRKANVERRKLDATWAMNGGIDSLPSCLEDDGKTFHYSKQYIPESARFIDLVDEDWGSDESPCQSCMRKKEKKLFNTPIYDEEEDCVKFKGDVYKIGNGVLLEPKVFEFEKPPEIKSEPNPDIDYDLYPEYYRKNFDFLKGSNNDTVEPFSVGVIESIENNEKLMIRVRKMYRPENLMKSMFSSYSADLNLLYYSEEEVTISFESVTGKCYISYEENIPNEIDEWIDAGPCRFYFSQMYDAKMHRCEDVPAAGKKIGNITKAGSKGSKSKSTKKRIGYTNELPPEYPKMTNQLNCLDVFAGCGGLSIGLHQSMAAVTKWAIEKEAPAAQAFKLNHPEAKIFNEDCNELLKMVMDGKGAERGYPQKGEVDMLVGGPPCQGFSGMNRFNAGQYSLFKNSLIVSYLSYCDYYRPKYFILENVRNFVSFKRSMVLKLTMRCLLAMGYQVTFGVLQAGHYGVPQTRRRLIIMASAPGYVLPNYPEPMHVFNKRGCQLSVQIGEQRFNNGCRWQLHAPYRTITVRDAMSDLPDINNGASKKELSYDAPITHFQRMMRRGAESTIVRDHVCKEMAPLVEARMSHIPTTPGSDWRDLPNIVLQLPNGTSCNKLRYSHYTKKQKQDGDEAPRGVCRCATGKGGCDPSDRQFNTLIPWCLPHTADRHNHWSGLYGRVEWDGFFSTTVTNPEPMGKQGRVLHPEQHRVVSVRESARSQGFPDSYQFAGTILDKHRQVGNAVPPPLGKAIGLEIARSYLSSVKQHNI